MASGGAEKRLKGGLLMVKKLAVLLVVLVVALTLSCPKKVTGIKGKLILQTGQSGDVRNCRVQLFVSSDLTGNPVKEVASAATGVDQTKSDFEFTDLVANYYYILAWKDLNGDGKVSDKDIVGINGGTYRPGYGGSQVTVTDNKETDVGEITMLIYKELNLSASTSLDVNNLMSVDYSFNYDVTVSSFAVEGVGDATQNGAKTATTIYHSTGWNVGGNTPPAGPYVLTIGGTWDGAAFSITDTVNFAG
jgi:uncharacterized protein (DUF2141 family)